MAESIFSKNIKALEKTNNLFAYMPVLITNEAENDHSCVDNQHIKIDVTRNGYKTMSISSGGKDYLMHSSYDVEKEAIRITENVDLNKDSLILVFGLGLGHHLRALKDKISPDSRVVVFEYNLYVLKRVLDDFDMTDIFGSGQFQLITGNADILQRMTFALFGTNVYYLSHNLTTLFLPNYYLMYQEEVLLSIQEVKKRITSTLYSFGNSLEDIFCGLINNYQNVDACIESNAVREIAGIYSGQSIPAIIVAAGPSLDKNIHHIIKAKNKAVIMACDASIRACEKYSVVPDGVASIERDEEIYINYYKEHEFNEETILFGPTLLWPEIFDAYKGKKILSSKMNDGGENWWKDQFEQLVHVDMGMSSATAAFAYAIKMGCNPIILIGQDLCYSEGKIHSHLTHTHLQGENNDREFDGIFLKDYEGNLMRSNIGYRLFKEWYEYKILTHNDYKIIDATEGGAYIEGSVIMTFEEAIEKYCVKNIEKNVMSHLEKIETDNLAYILKYNQILNNIQLEIGKLLKVKEEAQKHTRVLQDILTEYDIYKCNASELEKIVRQLEKGDRVIQYILHDQEVHSVINYYRQIIVQTISTIKKLGNELTVDNVRKNFGLQKNLMDIIEHSSDLVITKYNEIQTYLEDKKKRRLERDI